MNKNKIAVDLFNKLANFYQDKFMDLDLYNDSFDLFCENIKKQHATVLEMACGPGNITRYLLNKRPDLKILATDLSANMIQLAKINNPAAEVQLFDCREIGKLQKKYDAIMCGFCLPYLDKEEAIKLISDASSILTAKGIFYLSTMEDDYNKSGFKKGSTGDEIYIHYHEAGYLTEAHIKNGFEIINVQRKNYPGQDGSNSIDLVIIARKI